MNSLDSSFAETWFVQSSRPFCSEFVIRTFAAPLRFVVMWTARSFRPQQQNSMVHDFFPFAVHGCWLLCVFVWLGGGARGQGPSWCTARGCCCCKTAAIDMYSYTGRRWRRRRLLLLPCSAYTRVACLRSCAGLTFVSKRG